MVVKVKRGKVVKVKRGKIGDGMYRAFKIGKQLESIDQTYVRLLNPDFDLEKVDKDFDISPLSEYEKKDYWRIVNLKRQHENGLKSLSKQFKAFIADYHVSPILNFAGNELKTGYEGRRRGFRAKGCFKFSLWHPKWFQDLDLPKPPKRLTEVFG